jgi:hypothetical protein
MIDFGPNLLVNPSAESGIDGWTAINVNKNPVGYTGACFGFGIDGYLKQFINIDTSITNIFYISCYFKPQVAINIPQVQAYLRAIVRYTDGTEDITIITCSCKSTIWAFFDGDIAINEQKTIREATFEAVTNGITGYFDEFFFAEDYRQLETPIWGHNAAITIDNIGITTIALHWTAAFGRNSLKTYRINCNGEYTDVSATQTSYTLTKLHPATKYDIQIAVVDVNNKSNEDGPKATATTLPDTIPPFFPPSAQVVVTGSTENSISIEWTAAQDNIGVAKYRIYCNDTQVGTTQNTNFTVSNLIPLTSYTLAIDAIDAAGNASGKIQTTGQTTKSYEYGSGVLELEMLGGCVSPNVIMPEYELLQTITINPS